MVVVDEGGEIFVYHVLAASRWRSPGTAGTPSSSRGKVGTRDSDGEGP